jgi:DNA-binding transcriptional ArsR family regulator
MRTTDLLLHPVRLRIVHALFNGQELTTAQLGVRLPETSKVTVYRQVALLVEGGFLEVAGEQRVRGAVERRYRLRQDRPVIDSGVANEMSIEDHRRGFAAAMAVLMAEFNSYIDREGADPIADRVSYRQGMLWLSPDELTNLTRRMVEVVGDSVANKPAPDRTPYLLSPILFPVAPSAQKGHERAERSGVSVDRRRDRSSQQD